MTENIKKRRRRDNGLTMDAYSKHATKNDFCEAAVNENNLQKVLSLKKKCLSKRNPYKRRAQNRRISL